MRALMPEAWRAAGWIVDNSDANSGNSGFRAESGTAAG